MGKSGFATAEQITEESQAQKSNVRYNYLKVNTTTPVKQIRFLTLDGDDSINSYMEHFVKFNNDWSRTYSCPDADNETSDCEICKVKSNKNGNGDVKDNKRANKFIMNVIERDAKDPDPETKLVPSEGIDTLKIFKFSAFLWQFLTPFYKEYGTIGDRDYTIEMIEEKVGTKTNIKYIVEPVTSKPAKLSKDDLELAEARPKLSDVEPTYDEADFVRLRDYQPKDDKSDVEDAVNAMLGNKSSKSSTSDVDDILGSIKKATTKSLFEEDKEEDKEIVISSDEDDTELDFTKLLAKSQKKNS